jgi:hypothetical protein
VIWALMWNVGTRRPGDPVKQGRPGEGGVQVAETTRIRVPMSDTGADCPVVCAGRRRELAGESPVGPAPSGVRSQRRG